MALINGGIPKETSKEFWYNELRNTRALLLKVNESIFNLSSGKGGAIQKYTIDTGQTRQTVERSGMDLASLTRQRDSLLGHISDIEGMLGISASHVRVVPTW